MTSRSPVSEDRLAFNETPPADQRARFGDRFVAFLRSLGYPQTEANELAFGFLPDLLEYDPSSPPGYPNGRGLTMTAPTSSLPC
ncbi:MAG TPA: hypothetical protein VIM30_10925 [Candidatus Limnocylindrales bacterium]|jgi:hypothetical protein